MTESSTHLPTEIPTVPRPAVIEKLSITPVPRDDELFWRYAVTVERAENGLFAVRLGIAHCLSTDNQFDDEPPRAFRSVDWLAEHRFTLDEACDRAQGICRYIPWAGVTAQQYADTILNQPTTETQ